MEDVETVVIQEKEKMRDEHRKLEEHIENIKSGGGHATYIASNLNFKNNKNNKSKEDNSLNHLKGLRAKKRVINAEINMNTFESNPNDLMGNNETKTDVKKVSKAELQTGLDLLRKYESNIDIDDIEMKDNINVLDKIPDITVNGTLMKFKDVFNNSNEYIETMNDDEYIQYDRLIVQYGLCLDDVDVM